jgi:small nuclear ribonucleoprotein (snRNP)-like protein
VHPASWRERNVVDRSVKLFFSIFKTLVGKEITVELKNDLEICGTLHSVDQYLNFRLNNVHVVNEERFPHMVRSSDPLRLKHVIRIVARRHFLSVQLSVKNCFIRGSVVRYVHIPPKEVDVELLQDATRREATQDK